MGNQNNIEDFLRDKFASQDNTPATDWHVFEEKLNRAIWFSRVRSAAAVCLFALALFAGFNAIQKMGTEAMADTWESPISYEIEGLKVDELVEEDLGDVVIVSASKAVSEVVSNKKPIAKDASSSKAAVTEKALPKHKAEQSKVVAAVGSIQSTPTAKRESSIVGIGSATESNVGNDPNPEPSSVLTEETAGADEVPVESALTLPDVPESPEHIKPLEARVVEALVGQYEQSEREGLKHDSEIEPFHDLRTLNFARPGTFKIGTPRSIMPPLSGIPKKSRETYISPLQAKNPWSYSVNVYPNFTFRRFRVDRKKVNFLHRDFVDAIEASESGGFSLNVGLEVSRRIGPITYLTGGVEYISYNTDASFSFTNFRDANVNAVTGEIESYRIKERPIDIVFADENSYHYLNFPLSISYQPWATSHIRLNLEAGGSFMYFLGAQGKTIDFTTLEIMELSERTYRKYLGSFSVKVGANYFISERINFGFEPTLMYFTNTIYTSEMPFYVIPYSVGLNVHMQVKLN